MKTSIFDMNLVLPPMLEMTEVEKEMPHWTGTGAAACSTNKMCFMGTNC